jgi:peptide/nickel transport system substrate-binding protein
MAIFLQKAWNEIGIKIEIDIQTAGMSRQLRNEGKLGLFRGSWIADYPDAENYLSCFYSGYFSPNGPNYTHFYNKQFDVLFNELAFGVFDTPKKQSDRLKLIENANQIIATEAPIVVLYYDKSLRLMQKNVKGLGNDAINRLDLKRVRN